MTGQERFDRYVDAGAYVAVDLVNQVRSADPAISVEALTTILAVDPPSVAQLNGEDVSGFAHLARQLDAVFTHVANDRLDDAATDVNRLLAAHPAHPHLAKETGRWRLHHHPTDVALVPMWTSICAENLARIIASDDATRLGTCHATGCGRVYLDESKNASRRYCSTPCNNRMRSAMYRRRRAGDNNTA